MNPRQLYGGMVKLLVQVYDGANSGDDLEIESVVWDAIHGSIEDEEAS